MTGVVAVGMLLYDWKTDTMYSSVLGGMGCAFFSQLQWMLSVGEIRCMKKKYLILFCFKKYSQITFRTNCGAVLSLFLLEQATGLASYWRDDVWKHRHAGSISCAVICLDHLLECKSAVNNCSFLSLNVVLSIGNQKRSASQQFDFTPLWKLGSLYL